MLPFDSESGRGFGSVFHHHNVKSQPLSGWDFFYPCPPCVGAVSRLGFLSIQCPKSCIGAGLRTMGLLLRLLRQRKAQKNHSEAACGRGTDVRASRQWDARPPASRMPQSPPRNYLRPADVHRLQFERHWGVAALRLEEAYVNILDPQVMA